MEIFLDYNHTSTFIYKKLPRIFNY